MTAPYMGSLFGAMGGGAPRPGGPPAFNPQLPPNLLAMLAQPGEPGANMAQNMMALGGGGGGAPPQAAAPAPAPAAPLPAPPPMAAPSQATNVGLMSGGMAAMQAARPEGGGTLGAALGAGLAAGTSAFVAQRDREKEEDMARAAQEQYTKRVAALPIPEDMKTGLLGMGAAEGSKLLAQFGIDLAKERAKPVEVAAGGKLFTADGKLIAENIPKDKPFEANLSSDMANALFHAAGRDPRDREGFLAPLSEEEHGRVKDYLQAMEGLRASRTNVTVNAGERAMNDANVAMWNQAVGQLTDDYAKVKSAPQRVKLYDEMLDALESKDLYSGSLAEVRTKLAAFGKLAGLPVDVTKLANTQDMNAMILNVVLQRLPELDARPTDKDMEVLMQAVGTVGTDPAALKSIFQRARDGMRFDVQQYRDRVQSFEQDFSGSPLKIPSYLRRLDVPAERKESDVRGFESLGIN